MKRICQYFLIFVLLALVSKINILAIEDTEAPVINNLSLNKNTLFGGEKVAFTLDGDDDITGINAYMLDYQLTNDASKKLSIQIDNQSDSNTFTQSYTIPKTTLPGTWQLMAIQIWDVAGNLRTYFKTSDSDLINFDALNLTILKDVSVDLIYPTLHSININPSTLTLPTSFTISVEATDNVTENLDISITVAGINVATQLKKTTGNTYAATFNVDDTNKYLNIYIEHIILIDEAGNRVFYLNDPTQGGSDTERRLLPDHEKIKISGITTPDTQPPVLKNYKDEVFTIRVPGIFRAYLDIDDDLSGFNQGKVTILKINENEPNSLAYFLYLGASSKTKDGYRMELPFNEFVAAESYIIGSIELEDVAGNRVTYDLDAEDQQYRLARKVINLVKGETADLITGTMNEDYETTIKESPDDARIAIDATKNSIIKAQVFDSIRDTNKTLVINNKAIEWVFYGKDIVHASKDIDSKITISTFAAGGAKMNIENYISGGNGLIIDFAENGLLPGKALIKIKADYTLRDYVGESDLYVYYYNEDGGGLEAIANKINISEDGFYEFYITHNSRYLISSKKAKSVIKDASAINKPFNNETLAEQEIIDTEDKQPENDKVVETVDVTETKPEIIPTETPKENTTLYVFGMILLFVIGYTAYTYKK